MQYTLYHASTESFTNFDENKIKANETDALYNGFWFSSRKDTSPSFRDPKTYKMYTQTLEEAQDRLAEQKRYVNRNNKTFSVGGGLAASIESDIKDHYEFRIRKRLVTPWEVIKEEN